MAGVPIIKKFQIKIYIHFALAVAQNIIKRSFATFCFTAENKKVVAIPPRTTVGQRNDDKGGLKLLHKFRVAAFRKLSRSVTFS